MLKYPRFASAIILEIAYGHRVESNDDTYLQLSEQLNGIIAGIGSLGVSVVDFFPIRAFDSQFEYTYQLTEKNPAVRHLPGWFPGASLHCYCECTSRGSCFSEIR